MNNRHQSELDISEYSYKKAVLAAKVLENSGEPNDLVKLLQEQAKECLDSENSKKRSFGIHLLRFLYKKGKIDIGWFLRRRLRGFLISDKSESVRLAAMDLLGAYLSKTGATSGIRESHYATILGFREKMLKRSPQLRRYESSDVIDDINAISKGENAKDILLKVISGL